jgi:hypothetical protein
MWPGRWKKWGGFNVKANVVVIGTKCIPSDVWIAIRKNRHLCIIQRGNIAVQNKEVIDCSCRWWSSESQLIVFVFRIEVLRKATMCPAFFPAGFNWTDEFSRRMISSLNAGHVVKKNQV